MYICISFSDVHCKRCIIDLMGRISEAYIEDSKQDSFIKDLMQLDVPNLFPVQSPEGDDLSIQKSFVDMISTFVRKNVLKETILKQVVEIMVCTYICNILALYKCTIYMYFTCVCMWFRYTFNCCTTLYTCMFISICIDTKIGDEMIIIFCY